MDHSPQKLTYGSLFTGVGGFDIGFDRAGYDCRWQVEWDKHCQQTLAYHWPNVPRHSDVCDVHGAELEPVDVITYGSPCQDLSVAGKRAGIDGGRSSMFFEAVRIFKEMRDATNGTFPRITIWENVPGALSSNRGDDFQAVLKALDDIGALGQWWNVLDAQFFGVPQRRRRVFLISVFDPAIIERVGSGEILPVGTGRRRNPKKGQPKEQVIAGLTATGVGTCGADDNQAQAGHLIPIEIEQIPFSRNDIASYAEGTFGPLMARGGDCGGGSETIIAGIFGRQRSDQYDETEVASTVAARDYKAATDLIVEPMMFNPTGGTHSVDASTKVSPTVKVGSSIGIPTPPAVVQPIAFSHTQGLDPQPSNISTPTLRANGAGMAVAEATWWDGSDVAPALTRNSENQRMPDKKQLSAAVEPAGQTAIVRRLTPVECERLQGYPDNWTRHRADGKTNSDSTRYKMCGNGVATPVAQWIAHHLKDIL